MKTNKMIVFHDGWRYFAAAYGLEIVSVFQPSPGREPTPRDLQGSVRPGQAIRDQGHFFRAAAARFKPGAPAGGPGTEAGRPRPAGRHRPGRFIREPAARNARAVRRALEPLNHAADPGSEGPDRALRRLHGAGARQLRHRKRGDHRRDRAQRFGKDHPAESDPRPGPLPGRDPHFRQAACARSWPQVGYVPQHFAFDTTFPADRRGIHQPDLPHAGKAPRRRSAGRSRHGRIQGQADRRAFRRATAARAARPRHAAPARGSCSWTRRPAASTSRA